MTANNSTQVPHFGYPNAGKPLYQLADGVSAMDLRDALNGKFAQLEAMLCQVTGEQGEGFRCCFSRNDLRRSNKDSTRQR